MLMLLLTLLVAVISGLIGGTVAARRQRAYALRRSRDAVDHPALDREIDEAARRWAEAQGRSALAPLLARKLRLMHRVQRRRGWSAW